MSVSLSWSTYIYHDVMQLFSSRPPLLLVVECEIPEDPLAVYYMQNFSNKLFDLLFSIYSVISQDDVLILDVKEVS